MDKKAMAIAIFRYGLIAPALHMSKNERKAYFSSLRQKEYDVPFLGMKRYKIGTFKHWLLQYQNGGLENLAPSIRSDSGITRRISDKIIQLVKEIITSYPFLSVSGIYRMLLRNGSISPGEFSETTLRNYVYKHKLRSSEEFSKIARKKFEKENINELWTADFMEGPYVPDGRKKRRSFLCGIIDDHSRMITGAHWYHQENCTVLSRTLKEALLMYGIPEILYTDNGSAFRTHYLYQACAGLGIALVHSRPYDSPSRGKIERFFGNVRERFLASTDIASLQDIEDLNKRFAVWLEKEYHQQMHHGINARPIDKYLESATKIKPKMMSEHELEQYFLSSITRKVKNDATISIAGKLYEVPAEYIRKKIELRFPLDDPEKITLYDEGKPVVVIRLVNPAANASKPHTEIHFKNIPKKEGEDDND